MLKTTFRILPRLTSKTRMTSGLVFARRAAAADVGGDDSRWQQAGNKSKDAGLLTQHNAWRGAKMARNAKWTVLRCTARNSRHVNSKSNLPDLALLLSAWLPVNPADVLIHQKWWGMRNAPFAFLWHSATRGRQQEKYSLVSQGCQSSPSCFQPDRQSAPSLLLVAKSPFPMKMHFTVKISIDALRFPHTQGVCGIPHSRKNLCVVHLNDV